jgi:putative hydrolase
MLTVACRRWLDLAIAGIHAAWYQGGTKKAHTLLEVNNHSLAPQRKKTVARDNNLEILRLCKKYEVPTILGSDAHILFQIADYERLYPLLAETDFPDELVMNY